MSMLQQKYKRAFVPNPNYRYDPQDILNIANEIVYVCDTPMFDNLMGDEFAPKFEQKIAQRMRDFNPSTDVLAYYGDSLIFCLMIMWLADVFDKFDVARFSSKENRYLIRTLSYDKFIPKPAQEQDLVEVLTLRPPLRPAPR